MEAALAKKDAVISEKDVVISEKSADLVKLSAELASEKFKYARLQRMIFGSKRERFISSDFPEQFKLEFEPKSVEIDQAVEAERETIRIAYERKKVKKAHPGRLALPSHLPVVETIIEPVEDTIGLVCIGQMGVSVPTSTFESWVKLGAQHIKPLFAVHRLYVFSEIYQQIDESPIKVQDRDKPGTLHQGYMWVRYTPLSKSVLFEYYKGRSPNEPLRDLSKFKGYIQTDGYAGYTHLAETSGITHLSCWSHARRYFDKALPNDQLRAAKVLKLIQLLYAIEALAREANMNQEQRHALRLEKSLPIINEIGSYIYNERSKVLPKSPIGVAFEYCANRWISLQNYLKDGMLEIDSNLIENSIRPLALGRKNYLFAGNHEAAENIAMFYSFFGTCKKNEVDPQKWLTYVINNINNTKTSKLKELLPQFIDKTLLS